MIPFLSLSKDEIYGIKYLFLEHFKFLFLAILIYKFLFVTIVCHTLLAYIRSSSEQLKKTFLDSCEYAFDSVFNTLKSNMGFVVAKIMVYFTISLHVETRHCLNDYLKNILQR